MTSILKALAAGAATALLSSGPALAQAGLEAPVPDRVLEQMRGGYIVVDGLAFDFGAEVRSYIDGELALESRITLGPQGLAASAPMDGAALARALASLAAGGVRLDAGGERLFVTANGDAAFVHRLQDGQISNLLVNRGDGHDFRQELNLTLTLPGFEGVQQGIAAARLNNDLVDQVSRFTARLGL